MERPVIYHAKEDPRYQTPKIDERKVLTRILMDGTQKQYHYIHGCFEGTFVKFVFCFPMKEDYQGRFFQHLSPFPGPDEERSSELRTGIEDSIGFAISHGAAFVESNMGSHAVFGQMPDPKIFYQSSAAVAEYCRVVAQELFGPHRVYGYVYGGSGGGFKTMSCIENTDAFDGAVPFVIGSPVSLPSCLTALVHGQRLLRHAWPGIVDALEPGGSGDPYQGLNEEEADALREITYLGIPPRTLYDFGQANDGSLPVLAPIIHMMDPAYFEDFWTKPGYLGAVEGGSAQRDRIQVHTKVVGAGILGKLRELTSIDGRNGVDTAWQKMLADGSNAYIDMEDVPEGEDLYLKGCRIMVESGAAKGSQLLLGGIDGKRVILGACYGMDENDIARVLGQLQPGDEVFLDNSDYIAIQTYHRHQVPADKTFTAWDQYKDETGQPIYPQRAFEVSYHIIRGTGEIQTGFIQCPIIVMNNLMDTDFPWQADWYRRKIAEALGEEKAGSMVRLWYNDNCPHADEFKMGDELHVTSYLGMLNQALLYLSRWVEAGIEPPQSSGYTALGGQIIQPDSAEERKGIQPVVRLSVNDAPAVEINAGETIEMTALVEIPEQGGACAKVEWSFEGETDFPFRSEFAEIETRDGLRCFRSTVTHTYGKAGVFFPVVRVESAPDVDDPYIRAKNICRARVVVTK